jgi:signal transduction histidine kinase
LKLTIEDNGQGFDLDDVEQLGGQGLRNIRERAQAIGASCRIESAPGQGPKINIEVNQ